MEAPFSICAPKNNLGCTKTLQDHQDKRIGPNALNKLFGQLWYLSEELVALAFFRPRGLDDKATNGATSIPLNREKSADLRNYVPRIRS